MISRFIPMALEEHPYFVEMFRLSEPEINRLLAENIGSTEVRGKDHGNLHMAEAAALALAFKMDNIEFSKKQFDLAKAVVAYRVGVARPNLIKFTKNAENKICIIETADAAKTLA